MGLRYARTDAGRAEIRARTLALSRPARNLLLVIDGSRDHDAWIGLVQGATVADLQALEAHGLVAALAEAPARSAAEAGVAPLQQAVAAMSYSALYDFLTAQAKSRFGLLKGYKLVLDIERCAALPELQALAARFIERVQAEQGEAGLRPLRQALHLES